MIYLSIDARLYGRVVWELSTGYTQVLISMRYHPLLAAIYLNIIICYKSYPQAYTYMINSIEGLVIHRLSTELSTGKSIIYTL
jgi:hypothetical protein